MGVYGNANVKALNYNAVFVDVVEDIQELSQVAKVQPLTADKLAQQLRKPAACG